MKLKRKANICQLSHLVPGSLFLLDESMYLYVEKTPSGHMIFSFDTNVVSLSKDIEVQEVGYLREITFISLTFADLEIGTFFQCDSGDYLKISPTQAFSCQTNKSITMCKEPVVPYKDAEIEL